MVFWRWTGRSPSPRSAAGPFARCTSSTTACRPSPSRPWPSGTTARTFSMTPPTNWIGSAVRTPPCEIGYGHPAQALLKASDAAAALVIGRRGIGGFAELMLGSTSQVCAALARTTLVVVPDTWRPDGLTRGQIVVGVDGSPSGQAALGFAFEMAAERAAELTLVHVPEVPETFPRPDLWVDPDDAPWHHDARKARRRGGRRLAGEVPRRRLPDQVSGRPSGPGARQGVGLRRPDHRRRSRPDRVHRAPPRLGLPRPAAPRALPRRDRARPLTDDVPAVSSSSRGTVSASAASTSPVPARPVPRGPSRRPPSRRSAQPSTG